MEQANSDYMRNTNRPIFIKAIASTFIAHYRFKFSNRMDIQNNVERHRVLSRCVIRQWRVLPLFVCVCDYRTFSVGTRQPKHKMCNVQTIQSISRPYFTLFVFVFPPPSVWACFRQSHLFNNNICIRYYTLCSYWYIFVVWTDSRRSIDLNKQPITTVLSLSRQLPFKNSWKKN